MVCLFSLRRMAGVAPLQRLIVSCTSNNICMTHTQRRSRSLGSCTAPAATQRQQRLRRRRNFWPANLFPGFNREAFNREALWGDRALTRSGCCRRPAAVRRQRLQCRRQPRQAAAAATWGSLRHFCGQNALVQDVLADGLHSEACRLQRRRDRHSKHFRRNREVSVVKSDTQSLKMSSPTGCSPTSAGRDLSATGSGAATVNFKFQGISVSTPISS